MSDFDDEDNEIPDDPGWGPIFERRPVCDEGIKMLSAIGWRLAKSVRGWPYWSISAT